MHDHFWVGFEKQSFEKQSFEKQAFSLAGGKQMLTAAGEGLAQRAKSVARKARTFVSGRQAAPWEGSFARRAAEKAPKVEAKVLKGAPWEGQAARRSAASEAAKHPVAAPVVQKAAPVAAEKAAPYAGALGRAKTYTKGMMTGGVLTAGGIGLNSLRHKANEGAMQPMQPGYY